MFGHESKSSASREAASLIAAALNEDGVELKEWAQSETDVELRPLLPADIAKQLEELAADHGLTKWDVGTSLLRHRLQHREAEIRQLIQQKEADDRQQMAEAEALEARQTKELEERSQWIEKRAHEIATSRDRPTVSIKEEDGRLFLKFAYDELAKAWVKQLPGAKWDRTRRAWHISVRYRKRLDAMLVEIEAAIALKWAEVERNFHDDPPPESLVSIKAAKGHVQARFKFDRDLLERFRQLKRRGIAWQDKPNYDVWVCSFRNRRHFYELAAEYPPKVAELTSN
ncbi:MAG: hypothetical protein CL820_12450 [Croceicoccus sp.]|nr:hypothetical protein [Croceicoccus sp.]|tara:strand:+ start:5563 stop:6417 length:855 start_codon:yes stop_codon:yes gene_type:complete